MGTEIGIKGVGLDPRVGGRIRRLVELRAKLGVDFEIFVDGGIRSETVPLLAGAGADGVVPGSLVLKAPDPVAALAWIHSLAPDNPILEERRYRIMLERRRAGDCFATGRAKFPPNREMRERRNSGPRSRAGRRSR